MQKPIIFTFVTAGLTELAVLEIRFHFGVSRPQMGKSFSSTEVINNGVVRNQLLLERHTMKILSLLFKK